MTQVKTAEDGDRTRAQKVEIIFPPEQISARLEALAREIAARGLEGLLVVAVLKGSFVFAADLIRAMHRVGLEPEVDFITLSSYRKSTTSRGQVEILRDLDLDVSGRNVLIVDDVLDSGRTLAFAKDLIAARGARSVHACVFIEKLVPRAVDIVADYRAFSCRDEYLVGFGMDVAHRYRQLPFVARIEKDR